MKKIVLTSVCALAVTGAAFAQGTVAWQSISPGGITFETNTTVVFGTQASTGGGTIGKTSITAGSFYYELLYDTSATQVAAPTTLAGLSSWSDSGLEAENNVSTAGALQNINPSADATVPFTATSSILVVGWSANLGTTWSAAETALASPGSVVGTALFGISSSGFDTPNASGVSPGATFFGTATGEIHSLLTPLDVVATPEPTTIALGVMGGLSLLALRRKKA
jgi:hypothetical protein